jgi:hypothetical protein
MHAIYERIVVAGPEIVRVRLTSAACAWVGAGQCSACRSGHLFEARSKRSWHSLWSGSRTFRVLHTVKMEQSSWSATP